TRFSRDWSSDVCSSDLLILNARTTLMTHPTPTPEAIAHFLKTNPDFFQQHASLFAELRVPHPHETRAISLGERQILTLRNRCKRSEERRVGKERQHRR